jgi:Fur family ferric uptake transcriptional regulator
LFHFQGLGNRAAILRRVPPAGGGGENYQTPEKSGAAGVDAPGLDKKKKMVFGLSYQLDLFGASHYYICNQVDFGVIGMSDSCDFRQYLATQGLKLTAVRLAVLEVLGDASRALRAQEILTAIRARRRVNKVTIYRILEDFSRRGMVRRLSLQGRVNHYELACEHRPPHPHFQCHTCREIECLDPAPMTRVWTELQGPLGNRADHIEIRLTGVCHKCREAEAT